MWHDRTQQHLCSIYRKTAETARGPPLGMPPDRLQPHKCPLDRRTLLRRIRHSSSRGTPKSRPVDADDSLASWRVLEAEIQHAIRGRRILTPRWSSQYSVSSRLSSPKAQPRGRESPPGPSATVRQPLSPSARYVVSCASLARSMTRRDKTRTATPRARSSKPNTLSPDPSGSPGPRQGSLRSRRHPDRARWIPPFRAQGPLRAVALLRTLST